MILGKYETKKRLGKGAFGDVLLAQDKKKNLFAVKMISLRSFAGQNSYLLEYLDSQIKCLKSMDSPYVMKLYQTDEDKQFKYLICEYCDGGDIINAQSKQPNKVFTLEKAIEVLSFVIKGLFSLHNAGFVHRDIKAQNILMKTENGKEVYKLADFGFTKNIKDISFTILGTGAYMSPEISNEEEYGFQIDMWAFGVLFYFMLNMEFPFKLNSAPKTKKKSEELVKLATDFSYKAAVQKSRKQITENCTPEVEDLFKKMLNPIPNQRIDFHDIRNHQLFKKYFPQQNPVSQFLYKNKSNNLKNKKLLFVKDQIQVNAKAFSSQIIKRSQYLQKQQNFIQNEKQKVQFLKQTLIEFEKNANLPLPEMLSLKFNIQKYCITILKNSVKKLDQKQRSKDLVQRWKDFFGSDEYNEIRKDLGEEIKKLEFQLDKMYDNCEDNLESIIKINSNFEQSFSKKTSQIDFEGNFKKSYRKSTLTCYEIIVKRIKSTEVKGNLANYHLALISICHAFNKVFESKEDLRKIFDDCFQSKAQKVEQANLSEIKNIMAQSSVTQLNALTNEIIVRYFNKEKVQN